MKKLLLLCLLFCSCEATPCLCDEGVIVGVYKCSLKNVRYEVRVECRDPVSYSRVKVHFFTNTLYQVGDTIKIVKK